MAVIGFFEIGGFHVHSRNLSSYTSVCLSVCLSVRLSACNRAAPTGRLSVRFDTGDFYENLARKSKHA